jgi:hypothetical protein
LIPRSKPPVSRRVLDAMTTAPGLASASASGRDRRPWGIGAQAMVEASWVAERRHRGKKTEGRDLLAPIYGWFTEGFHTPVLQDAKALLD